MSFDWKSLIEEIAPTIATALGGPLAGTAVSALSNTLLGKPDGTVDEVSKALSTADPTILQKVREADQKFALDMRGLDIDLEKISAEDRNSARQREMAVKDNTPSIIAYGAFVGFFGVLIALLFHDIPAGAKDSLLVMLGALGTMVTSIVAYYYGSSSGSAAKSKTIDELMKK